MDDKKLENAIHLLRTLVALELFKNGVSRGEISKRLKIRTETVVKMLKGVKTPNTND